MKRLTPVLLGCMLMLSHALAFSQTTPKFQKFDIGKSGATVYMPGDPGEFELTLSEDKSEVWTGEVTFEDFNYACITVKFAEPIGDNKDENTSFLETYLDFLQEQFEITDAAGYGEGHELESNPKAIGVIDYWEDSEGLQYNVAGWIDNNMLCVLLVYGNDEPNYNYWEMFKDGFRFPGSK